MHFLVCGDLHLKPAASDYDIDAMVVPDDVEVALILGDLTHRAGPDDVDLARQFINRLGSDIPVVYVPGNHDHKPTEEQVVEPISSAYTGHRTLHEFDNITVAGWGCEQRALNPPIDQCEFDALDPRDVPRKNRRYAADEVANNIESVCHDTICGTSTLSNAAVALGIKESEQSSFKQGIQEIRTTYEELVDLLEGEKDVILATHVPPFNTSFDRHHAVGAREEDREYLHTGSIALKIAIHEYDVFAALSGHSHIYGYDVGDGDDGRPHYLNLGFRGIETVSVDPEGGLFAFTQASTGNH